MYEYELDILGNAIDSLNESLEKYSQGQNGNAKAYKFSILHLCHFMELTLKYYISTLDESLIFSKVFRELVKHSKQLNLSLIETVDELQRQNFDFEKIINGDQNPHTITADMALQLVESDQKYFDSDLSKEIRALKGLRNDIEHHKFKMNIKEVRLAIGRLIRGFHEFTDVFGVAELTELIDKSKLETFNTLADEYEHELQEANNVAKEAHDFAFRGVRPKHYYDVIWDSYDCPKCGQSGLMIPDEESLSGFKCTFCGNEESDDIEVECEICGASWPNGEMSSWEGTYTYTCPDCNDFQSKY